MARFKKVKTGSTYVYDPVMLDRIDGRTSLKKGAIVTVVKLPGCPPPNTMGHAHVNHNGTFAGLVCTNSLVTKKEFKERYPEAKF